MTVKNTLLVFFQFACLANLFAQKHDSNILFGYFNNSTDPLLGGATMNFNTPNPKIFAESKKIDIDFYCGVCSDSTGLLQFYTNGISIRDKTHERMLNGDTINPGYYWESYQSFSYPNGPFCFALPAPGKSNQYYLFHMGIALNTILVTSPFYFTEIDMNANNGLGAVTHKNQVLLPLGLDLVDPVAVKHGNGRDWWIITGELSTAIIYTFLLDPDGVHGPFETDMAFTFPGPEYQSINAMSPDGKKYVRCDGLNGLYIFDFDRCSGSLNNQQVLPFADPEFFGFATVFAPDSRHLYLSSWETLTVLDLGATDIAASFDTLAYFDGQASPQEPFLTGFFIPNLGPNDKIYYATTNGTLSMHVIHHPNLPGHAADVEQHGLDLPKFNSGTMCLFPNYRLGEWEGAPCDTLNFQQPGDGFEKIAWYPPAFRKEVEYSLLPPIGGSCKPIGDKPRPYRPRMTEIALKRLDEQKREKEEKKETNKN